MPSDLVLTERPEAHIARVVLNRPGKRNAMNIALLRQLVETLQTLSAEQDTRVIVLSGAGDVFCAGLDLKEAQDTEKAHESAELVAAMLEAVASCPKVTICQAHGAAIAGGAGLMLACDFAIAEPGMKTGFPEVHRGLVAGLVMTFLRRKVSEPACRALLLLGELIDGRAALKAGLIHDVAPREALSESVLMLARKACKGAPGAMAHTKALLATMWPQPVRADLDRALEAHMAARTSPEAAEGMRAFAEKRDPVWP